VLDLELELDACKRSAVDNIKTVAFLNGVLEQSLAGIYVIDNGLFTYVNKTFADIFGYMSPDEIVGKLNINRLIAPECRDLVREDVQKRTTGEIGAIRYTFYRLA
jgi:PAS domain S-box-containing protein